MVWSAKDDEKVKDLEASPPRVKSLFGFMISGSHIRGTMLMVMITYMIIYDYIRGTMVIWWWLHDDMRMGSHFVSCCQKLENVQFEILKGWNSISLVVFEEEPKKTGTLPVSSKITIFLINETTMKVTPTFSLKIILFIGNYPFHLGQFFILSQRTAVMSHRSFHFKTLT